MKRIEQLPRIAVRNAHSHKGTFGKVCIIAGSRGMSGAAVLSGLGALRGGAGLVSLALPESLWASVASAEPAYLTVPLLESEHGQISFAAAGQLLELTTGQDAVAFGPGVGESDELRELCRELYLTVEKPMVVDASGLNLLAACLKSADAQAFRETPAPRILTPHPKEFSRLSGHSMEEILNNREESAAKFAREYKVTLVLKGHKTVITDGSSLAINRTGNPGMATGGAGDVLTGMITALLAQGCSPFEAAQLGAHLHGLAGDFAAKEFSQPGMIASDLPRFLGAAWKEYLESV